MNKSGVKNLTIEILDTFLGLPEALISGFDRKGFYCVLSGKFPEKYLSVSNICNTFYRFKKSGYIEVSNVSGNESIKFTNKAKLLVVDRLANRYSIDNKFHFVSFDIPENK